MKRALITVKPLTARSTTEDFFPVSPWFPVAFDGRTTIELRSQGSEMQVRLGLQFEEPSGDPCDYQAGNWSVSHDPGVGGEPVSAAMPSGHEFFPLNGTGHDPPFG